MRTRSLTDVQLAKQLKCSIGALRKWRYGERIPRPDQMRRIAEATEGLVTPNDFLMSVSREEDAA